MLSAPRFATYLRATAGDRTRALELYHWNLQVSAAFLVPLHLFEVVIRNAVVEAIDAVHGGVWPWTEGFIRSLKDPRPPAYSPKRDLRACADRHETAGKVVADLRFVFWERMLTAAHHDRIWEAQFFRVFPAAPAGRGVASCRAELRDDIEKIRELRNRIAHHEPVFTRDLQADFDLISRAIGWRTPVTGAWMSEIQTVTALLGVRQ
ncbi:MAG: hypothetical protein R3D78_03790 [Paracoccaceae bacterium]